MSKAGCCRTGLTELCHDRLPFSQRRRAVEIPFSWPQNFAFHADGNFAAEIAGRFNHHRFNLGDRIVDPLFGQRTACDSENISPVGLEREVHKRTFVGHRRHVNRPTESCMGRSPHPCCTKFRFNPAKVPVVCFTKFAHQGCSIALPYFHQFCRALLAHSVAGRQNQNLYF